RRWCPRYPDYGCSSAIPANFRLQPFAVPVGDARSVYAASTSLGISRLHKGLDRKGPHRRVMQSVLCHSGRAQREGRPPVMDQLDHRALGTIRSPVGVSGPISRVTSQPTAVPSVALWRYGLLALRA